MSEKADKYHWHELLDRTHLALDFFHENVLEHQTVSYDKELRKGAEELLRSFFRFQSIVASKYSDNTER